MKKAILTKIITKPVTSAITINSPENPKSKLAYAELFRAVLQIPEKDVQLRILEAVNGKSSATAQINHAICPNCKQIFGTKTESHKTISTQTDINEIVSNLNNQAFRIIALPLDKIPSSTTNSSANSDDSRDGNSQMQQKSIESTTMIQNLTTAGTLHPTAARTSFNPATPTQPSTDPDEEESITPTIATEATLPLKRKRRRKLCVPQVVKRSHAQMAQTQTQLQPKIKVRKFETSEKPVAGSQLQANDSNVLGIFDRRDSIGPIQIDALMEEILKEPTSKEEHIMRLMAEECLNAEKRTDGLLTIHHSIVDNDWNALRRQIFVWKKLRKVNDLNGLLTDDDENCLQLAIMQDCYPKVIDILLNEGLNMNEIDDHSNTCIHLAILNEIELESLRLLMQKIDLKLLLLLNDDGYTPLHIAVRTDSYLSAEIIINALDERLKTKPLLRRSSERTTTKMMTKMATLLTKHEFSKYYQDVCKMLDKRYTDDTTRNAQPKLKKKLLDAGDRKSGNTALFFAIENKLEHFVFFLLAHLTDPRIINFSGQDAQSYYTEFGKTLSLSCRVEIVMDSVVSILRN